MAPQSKPNNRRLRPRLDTSRLGKPRITKTSSTKSKNPKPVRPSIGKVTGPASNPKPPKPAKPQGSGPVRPSIGKVTGPASNPRRPSSPQDMQGRNIKTPGKGGWPAGTERWADTGKRGGALRNVAGAVGKGLGIVGTGVSAALTANSIVNPNSDSNRNLQRAIAGVTSRMAEDGVRRQNQSQPRGGRSGSGRPSPAPSPSPTPTRTGTGGRGVSPGSVRSTPTPKPTPTPTPSPTPTRSSGSSSGGGGGRSYSPSPSPSPSRSSSPAPTPTPSPKPEASKTGGGAYGKDGKQLYMADKKNNPLMKRTFGYQTGDAPDQRKAKESTPSTDTKSKTGGRAAVAGAGTAYRSGDSTRTQELLKRIAEMKKRQQG